MIWLQGDVLLLVVLQTVCKVQAFHDRARPFAHRAAPTGTGHALMGR